MAKAQFGMIGLGTMGRNFLLNVAEHGFSGAGYDLDAEKRRLLLEEGKDYDLQTAETLPESKSTRTGCAASRSPRTASAWRRQAGTTPRASGPCPTGGNLASENDDALLRPFG